MIDIVILGGEGNGGVVASVIESGDLRGDEKFRVVGFLNDFEKEEIAGYPVLGRLQDWHKLHEKVRFVWAIHPIGNNLEIEKAMRKVTIPQSRFSSIIHSDVFIAPTAQLGTGVFVMKGGYIGPRSVIGDHSMLMANVNFGHDSRCGKCCHFSVGSIVSSYVVIGDFSDVTLGARVLEKVKIGNFAVVGSCALATKDVGDGEVVIGVPARYKRHINGWHNKANQ